MCVSVRTCVCVRVSVCVCVCVCTQEMGGVVVSSLKAADVGESADEYCMSSETQREARDKHHYRVPFRKYVPCFCIDALVHWFIIWFGGIYIGLLILVLLCVVLNQV